MLPHVEKLPTGPSYWAFNSSLLDDPKYINLIKNNIPLLKEFSDVLDLIKPQNNNSLYDYIIEGNVIILF